MCVWGGGARVFPALGRQRQEDPWGFRPASLVKSVSSTFSERPYLRKTPRARAWPPLTCSHTHFFSSSGRCHSRFSLVLLGVCHTARVSCVIWMVSFAEIRQIHWQMAVQSTFNLACSNPSPGLPGHGFLLAYRIRQDSLLRTPGPWGWVCIHLPTPLLPPCQLPWPSSLSASAMGLCPCPLC